MKIPTNRSQIQKQKANQDPGTIARVEKIKNNPICKKKKEERKPSCLFIRFCMTKKQACKLAKKWPF